MACFGDSILWHALNKQLLKWDNPVNLGLDHTLVSFRARRGLHLNDLPDLVERYIEQHGIPDSVIVCVGANDMGKTVYKIRCLVKQVIGKLQQQMPSTQIVWSDILHRPYYESVKSQGAAARKRQHMNNRGHHYCQHYISHPNILKTAPVFFDTVHLNNTGMEVLLGDILRYLWHAECPPHLRGGGAHLSG